MKCREQLSVIGTEWPTIARAQSDMLMNNIPIVIVIKLRSANREGRHNVVKGYLHRCERKESHQYHVFRSVSHFHEWRKQWCRCARNSVQFLGADESFLDNVNVRTTNFWQRFVVTGTTYAVNGADVRGIKYNKNIHVPNQ